MASMRGKRVFIIFVISPPVLFFLLLLGLTIHWVIGVIGFFAVIIITEIASRMRCPRCGVITKLYDWRQRENIVKTPLLCKNCGYNFSQDVGKARKKKKKAGT